MRAWRSDSRARTASSLRTEHRFRLLSLLAILILAGSGVVSMAMAAPPRATRPAPDSTDESGFKVRVVEESKGRRVVRTVETTDSDEPQIPEANPEPPYVPEPPDTDEDSDANDLVRFGEDITIAADKVVDGNVVAMGGDVTVLGRVKGDVVAVGGGIEIEGNGAIEGDAVSLGGGVATSDSASVGGSNVSIGTMRFWRGWGLLPIMGVAGAVGFGTWLASFIVKLLLTLFFAWLALLLWRDGILRAAAFLQDQFGKSFLWGLLTLAGLVVAIPVGIVALLLVGVIAVVILCITIIGIPVAVLLVIALVAAIVGLVVGSIFVIFLGHLNGVYYLGRRVLGTRADRVRSPLIPIAVGMAVIAALGLLGHLAGFVGVMMFHPLSIAFGIAARALSFILTVAGLGALWLSFVQGGGFRFWRGGTNWGPLRRREPAMTTPVAEPPPATGGSSDAP